MSKCGKNKAINDLLIFLEKTGNEKAKSLLMNRHGFDLNATTYLLKEIERGVFCSQPSGNSYKGIDAMLKSIGYLSK